MPKKSLKSQNLKGCPTHLRLRLHISCFVQPAVWNTQLTLILNWEKQHFFYIWQAGTNICLTFLLVIAEKCIIALVVRYEGPPTQAVHWWHFSLALPIYSDRRGKSRETYSNLFYCNSFPCMLLRVITVHGSSANSAGFSPSPQAVSRYEVWSTFDLLSLFVSGSLSYSVPITQPICK